MTGWTFAAGRLIGTALTAVTAAFLLGVAAGAAADRALTRLIARLIGDQP